MIDTQRMSAILTTNRIDKVISDVTEDNRVDTLLGDPSAYIYFKRKYSETSAHQLNYS